MQRYLRGSVWLAVLLLTAGAVGCDSGDDDSEDVGADTVSDAVEDTGQAVDTGGIDTGADAVDSGGDTVADTAIDAADTAMMPDTRWPDVDPGMCGSYVARGSFEVGVTRIDVDGTPVEIWYPSAEGATQGEQKATYDMRQWLPEDE